MCYVSALFYSLLYSTSSRRSSSDIFPPPSSSISRAQVNVFYRCVGVMNANLGSVAGGAGRDAYEEFAYEEF